MSHFGFLTLSPDKNRSTATPSLVKLDANQPGFAEALESLDKLPTRSTDTLHVFYMKSGQRRASDILGNVNSQADIDGVFLELLLSLGWPVNVKSHAGWTGHLSTSFRVEAEKDLDTQENPAKV